MADRIQLAIDGPVATVTLNNPAKRNSFDLAMGEQLTAAARGLAKRGDIGVVVLRGAGNEAFSGGADFDALTAEADIAKSFAAVEHAFDAAVNAIAEIEVPIIAAIRGACFGGAVQLMLTADIRIASAEARFCVPAAAIGIVYPLEAVEKIVRLAGTGAASHVLIGAEPFDAAEAKARRLIEEIVPTGALDERVKALCGKIATYPRPTLIAYKKLIRGFAARAPHSELVAVQDRAHATGAHIERLRAIAARRREKR